MLFRSELAFIGARVRTMLQEQRQNNRGEGGIKTLVQKPLPAKEATALSFGAGASYCPERQAIAMNAIHC